MIPTFIFFRLCKLASLWWQYNSTNSWTTCHISSPTLNSIYSFLQVFKQNQRLIDILQWSQTCNAFKTVRLYGWHHLNIYWRKIAQWFLIYRLILIPPIQGIFLHKLHLYWTCDLHYRRGDTMVGVEKTVK